MGRFGKRFAAVGLSLMAGAAGSGCESLQRRPSDRASEILANSLDAEGVAKPRPKKSWSPGGWSSEARDIESSVMKSSPDASWRDEPNVR